MDFFTSALRKSNGKWVALCLENGIVGQGETQEEAINNLKDAVESYCDAVRDDPSIDQLPLSIRELHEFLKIEGSICEIMELRAIYA